MKFFNFFKRTNKNISGANDTNNLNNAEIDVTLNIDNNEPDLPEPFGYKMTWYAIKDESPHAAIEKLSLKVVHESNWRNGIGYAYRSPGNIFVSPLIEGYVLILGLFEYDDVKKHALLFNDLYYFGTHCVSEYQAWAKFSQGQVIRGYCYMGECGEVLWNEGNITAEEEALGFGRFPSNTDETLADDFDYENFPDEEDVLAIAKAWSVCTKFEGEAYEKGMGFICEK
ncbi:MAG: hypothetical protein FWE42_01095 [Defluviitaleaceae bacterium]|nr:hypothetical protein [Defluviitaleaceae bacterium]